MLSECRDPLLWSVACNKTSMTDDFWFLLSLVTASLTRQPFAASMIVNLPCSQGLETTSKAHIKAMWLLT